MDNSGPYEVGQVVDGRVWTGDTWLRLKQAPSHSPQGASGRSRSAPWLLAAAALGVAAVISFLCAFSANQNMLKASSNFGFSDPYGQYNSFAAASGLPLQESIAFGCQSEPDPRACTIAAQLADRAAVMDYRQQAQTWTKVAFTASGIALLLLVVGLYLRRADGATWTAVTDAEAPSAAAEDS